MKKSMPDSSTKFGTDIDFFFELLDDSSKEKVLLDFKKNDVEIFLPDFVIEQKSYPSKGIKVKGADFNEHDRNLLITQMQSMFHRHTPHPLLTYENHHYKRIAYKTANRIVQAFLNREAHDFSSVQCNFPSELAQEIIAWGKANIADEDLAGDGREDNIHVTVKYGLHGHDPFELRSFLSKIGPIEVTLGKISIFSNDTDVIKIDLISPKLHVINQFISDHFDHTNTHPDYRPHLTLCYVKSGLGSKYEGRTDFEGRKVILGTILFSGNDNRETTFSLI